MLLGLGRVGIVHDDTTGKADRGGALRYEDRLLCCLGIELQHGTGTSSQHLIQRREEARQTLLGDLTLGVGIAQPLQSTDGNAGIERGRTEGKSRAHVMMHQISSGCHCLTFAATGHIFIAVVVVFVAAIAATTLSRLPLVLYPLIGHLQHITGHIASHPHVSLLLQDLAREARSTTNIEDEGGLVVGKAQQFDGTFGDLPLDANHTRRAIILPSLLGIVEERSVACQLRTRHDCNLLC